MRHALVAVAAVLAVATPVFARQWAPRTDQEIVALDLQTGALKWTHKSTPIGEAHFELYSNLLAVYPNSDQADKSHPLLLDPKTGQVVPDTRHAKKLLKAAAWPWAKGPIVLSNGWRHDDFEAHYMTRLDFVDPKTSKVVWTLNSEHYLAYARSYKDLLLVVYDPPGREAVILAYRVGTQRPAWSIDFNKLLHKPAQKQHLQRLYQVAPQLIDDVLYLQTREHLFKIDPLTGKIGWHRNAAAALDLDYEPDMYGGALDIAVFARDGDVLVASFERCILALRASTGAVLWSMVPNTFPHLAFPLAADGTVYIPSGPDRSAASAPPKKAASKAK